MLLGIDSCDEFAQVGLWQDAQILTLKTPEYQLPAYMFRDHSQQWHFGLQGKRNRFQDPNNTCFGLWRFLSLPYQKHFPLNLRNRFPFLSTQKNSMTGFEIEFEKEIFSIYEIFSHFIGYVRDQAQDFFEESIPEISLVIPDYVTQAQIKILKTFLKRHDIQLASVLAEPFAHLFSIYDLVERHNFQQVAILYLGETECKWWTLAQSEAGWQLVQSDGDLFAGIQFQILKKARTYWNQILPEIHVRSGEEGILFQRIYDAFENAFWKFRLQQDVHLEIPYLTVSQKDNEPFSVNIEFDFSWYDNLLNEFLSSMERFSGQKPFRLLKSGAGIIICGPMSRMPGVSQHFSQIAPDQCVVLPGEAHAQNGILRWHHTTSLQSQPFLEQSIGLLDAQGVVHPLVHRAQRLPFEREFSVVSEHRQDPRRMELLWVRGETKDPAQVKPLARYELKKIGANSQEPERREVRLRLHLDAHSEMELISLCEDWQLKPIGEMTAL